MSSEPSFNGNNTSPVQRLLIAAGALIVVALTVIAAVLLAVQPAGQDKVTPVASVALVTGAPTNTAIVIVSPTASPTSLLPSPTPVPLSPTATTEPVEAATDTPIPPTATNTAVPQPPTATSTPVVVIVTPTPLPTTAPAPAPGGTPGVCQPPANWFAYTVQSGDTLNSLSTRTGVSVFDLQQVNCLPTFTIQPGQVIYLPFNPPTPTVTNTPLPATATSSPSPSPTFTPIPRPPEIFTINISIARDTIVIGGRGFEPDKIGFRVQLTGSIGTVTLELGDLRSSTGFEAKIPEDLPGGDYDLRIINPDDQFVIRRITIPAAP